MADNRGRFWKVNSYGYPNPFNPDVKAQHAWETFLSFFDFASYAELKAYWESGNAPRRLSAHALESWKSTLEEFGLLYVISGSGVVTITPAGRQFRAAAEGGRHEEFAWIGLSLLLRYPLRGAPRGGPARHGGTDLLLYWFIYVALLDLENTVWWTELERVLCTVFTRAEAVEALQIVRQLRARTIVPSDVPLVADRRGAFYNSLNQVVVHASMNNYILGRSTVDVFYGESEISRRHWILPEWRDLVVDALGGAGNECDDSGSLVARMPAAPVFKDERSYFEYVGAPVGPRPVAVDDLEHVALEGKGVALLREHSHYEWGAGNVLAGNMRPLCQLRVAQRVILGHDLKWSYVVQAKQRTGVDSLQVTVRRGRPISSPVPLYRFLTEGKPDDPNR